MWGVQVANDVVIWVKGISDIEILTMGKTSWKHGIIHDVLYVLNLMKNIFSLVKNGDKRMTAYNKTKCKLYPNGEEGFVMAWLRHGNLWKMQIIVIMLRTQANMGPHIKCSITLLHT
jgi:hypothetical protein